jgi:hypothetical protein
VIIAAAWSPFRHEPGARFRSPPEEHDRFEKALARRSQLGT